MTRLNDAVTEFTEGLLADAVMKRKQPTPIIQLFQLLSMTEQALAEIPMRDRARTLRRVENSFLFSDLVTPDELEDDEIIMWLAIGTFVCWLVDGNGGELALGPHGARVIVAPIVDKGYTDDPVEGLVVEGSLEGQRVVIRYLDDPTDTDGYEFEKGAGGLWYDVNDSQLAWSITPKEAV